MTIESFGPEHLAAAAELLAARQRRLRSARPELPERFADPAATRPLLSGLLERHGAHGVVAVQEGSAVGYLLGYRRTEEIWGRACWSPVEGQALDAEVGADLIGDLYAAWGQHWVERGVFRHYVHAPHDDPDLLETWSLLNFGKMQAHAVGAIADVAVDPPQGVEIRRAMPDDLDLMMPLAPLISHQLIGAPAFAISLPERFDTFREEWAEELRDPDARIWLALADGRALAMAGFYPADPGPMVPDDAVELAVAMTLPEARRRGLQRALLGAGFREAAAAGAGWCITDWRTASLAAARSWTAIGFRPTHFRLHRHVDERIAWAHGRHAS